MENTILWGLIWHEEEVLTEQAQSGWSEQGVPRPWNGAHMYSFSGSKRTSVTGAEGEEGERWQVRSGARGGRRRAVYIIVGLSNTLAFT